MKKISAALLVIVLAVLGSCNFILGPDKPAAAGNEEGGTGNLVISIGGGGAERAIAPGGTLPSDVLAVLRYELTLTGPGGSTLTRTVSSGENLNMTVIVGGWRIDAQAYQDAILAGTGSLDFTVGPGTNSVQVPMNMSGPCYEITVSNDTIHGTVRSNFTAAFAGTEITITAEKDGDAFFIDGSLEASTAIIGTVAGGPGTNGTSHSFTMPAEDVALYADFRQFARYVREGGIGYGESWEDASDDLQAMMDELEALTISGYSGPYIVKVGAGTYKPQYKPNSDYTTNYGTPANDRDSAFLLRPGVQVWGGYAAGGEDIDEATRKGRFNVDGTVKSPAHKAVLSGDIDGVLDVISGSGSTLAISGNTENARHVVLAVDIPTAGGTVLDGLTIEGGNADNASSYSITVNSHSISGNLGGGMKNEFSSPKLTNVTISGNNSKTGGGGMHNINSSPEMANVTISGNTALLSGAGGGGISNESSSSPKMTDVTISGNNANYGGGIFSGTNSAPVLTNVTISGNNADGTSGGGGMFNSSTAPVLANVTISGNTTNGNGGGIYNTSSAAPVLDDVIIFNNNTASYGGGMFNSSSSPVMSNVTISNNTAVYGGGGMYNDNSSPVMSNVTISGNKATNSASRGGGIYNSGSSSKPVLVNMLVSGNLAAGDGGGVYNDDSSPKLLNVTISGNTAANHGGGIYHHSSTDLLSIGNSIIWGNKTTTNSWGGIYIGSGNINIGSSIVQGSTGNGTPWNLPTDGGIVAHDLNNIESPATNTLFEEWIDPASASMPNTLGNYRLQSGSPAINEGNDSYYPASADNADVFPASLSAEAKEAVNAALLKDLGGSTRIQGSIIDMGAYERE